MEFITDRTKSDVLLGTEKGRYGAADLNRVETAVKELSNIAKAIGVNQELITKTNWGEPAVFSNSEWPTKSQMERYLNNVLYLCSAVEARVNLPKTMEKLDWQGANQIEEGLQVVYERIQNIVKLFRYSGEFYAGEESYL